MKAFKEPLSIALEAYFNDQSASVLETLFHTLNSFDMSNVPCLDYLKQSLIAREAFSESAATSGKEVFDKYTYTSRVNCFGKGACASEFL